MRSAGFVVAMTCAAMAAHAQSFNVDFGAPGSAPAAAYAAAGLAGTWNVVGVLPSAQRQALATVEGTPSGVEIYMIGGTALHAADDPATSGDDAALLDDMLIGYNDPVDVCVWFANVPAGEYEVILYGLTPSDPLLQHRLRVDYATPGPTMCGGAWPGVHQEGISYVRFRVMTDSGYIGLHSGLWAGNFVSGLNGIQLRANPPTGTEPPATGATRSAVLGAFPNPSRERASIAFALAESSRSGRLQVFDAAGRLVWDASLSRFAAGRHTMSWDGRDTRGIVTPAGVYFARLSGVRHGDAGAVRLVRMPAAAP
jgi:hypothetical protein